MNLTILLTSYNRPALVARSLESLIAQTDDRWQCCILDDGSNAETLAVLRKYADEDARIQLVEHQVSDEERSRATRYSVLINEVLPKLTDGVVGYMCDNVEYHPDLVGTVLDWFERGMYAGYVDQIRDVWSADGTRRMGNASDFGHWDLLPPISGPAAVFHPDGWLDHSQVFHRLPADVFWNESIAVVKRGDGDFFTRLVERHGPIHPISAGNVLTIEHLIEGRV